VDHIGITSNLSEGFPRESPLKETGMLGLDVRICLPQRHLDHLEFKKITKKNWPTMLTNSLR